MGRTKDRGHRTKAIVLCLLSFVLSWGLDAAPSADGANLVFTVKCPGTAQGFIAIFVQ